MITNAGLVAGVIIGLAFLLAGVLLLKRGAAGGGGMISLGALVYFASQVYGLIELRPFIGRDFDESWSEQIALIELLAMVGLLLCAAGIVAHALAHKRA